MTAVETVSPENSEIIMVNKVREPACNHDLLSQRRRRHRNLTRVRTTLNRVVGLVLFDDELEVHRQGIESKRHVTLQCLVLYVRSILACFNVVFALWCRVWFPVVWCSGWSLCFVCRTLAVQVVTPHVFVVVSLRWLLDELSLLSAVFVFVRVCACAAGDSVFTGVIPTDSSLLW
jgi:hypothetical protein